MSDDHFSIVYAISENTKELEHYVHELTTYEDVQYIADQILAPTVSYQAYD
jgi:hypothetical protein